VEKFTVPIVDVQLLACATLRLVNNIMPSKIPSTSKAEKQIAPTAIKLFEFIIAPWTSF
jgi:hypothetical protein